ncbi:uncharacterized protein BYT42DRAFT_165690 [Radiomyces spectabilis]|uniref:uncharacterized protein n=1 Tax=Radiomyces spectabilis TaxID=64574 RepID=UPI00221EE8BC|nr:uncharacterized protein BYT42DRAFT_165690 [Radiomyces spectabilis]KAI8364686.1 hypothetical protein BYT42DRAFT_165690 [Radiomyces spectabilis]
MTTETSKEEQVMRSKDKASAWTIEGMVKRSLDPTITHSEHKEYRRYTQQFRSVEKLTISHGDQRSYANIESFPEYQQYLNYIHRNAPDEHPSALKTQSIDEQVYNTYVDIPRRAAAAQFSREWSSTARKRYEGYLMYLRTGRYMQQPSSVHPSTPSRQPTTSLQDNTIVANSTAAALLASRKPLV